MSNSFLRPSDVLKIRREVADILARTTRTRREAYESVAQQWEVHPRTVERIVRRHTFKDVS